jgi:hypothetical protein
MVFTDAWENIYFAPLGVFFLPKTAPVPGEK